MRKHRRSSALGAWIAAGTLATTGLVAGTATAAVQPHGTSGGWHQLSKAAVVSADNLGLARFGSSLQVAWIQDNGGTSQSLRTRIVGSSGAPTSAAATPVSGWSQLSGFPAVFANGKQRVIAFSGLQNEDTQHNPYAQGYEYYVTSSNGTSWTLSQGALSEHATAYGSTGTDAVDAHGTPVVGYTDQAPTAVEYHSGFIATIPTSSGSEQQTTPTASCCTYDTGLGYDAKSSKSWAVWYSNSNQSKSAGILAQPIEPALGTQFVAPDSFATSAGDYVSLPPNQRIVTAARVGGGIYASYFVGYPSASKVALWKLGAAKAKTHGTGGIVGHVGVAAAPNGRIWLYWWNLKTHTISAVETNGAVSSFGHVCHVSTPGKTTGIWDLVGNAGKGPLQLFVIAGSSAHAQVYDTIIKPC